MKDSVNPATKPIKNPPVLVAGLPQSGKTLFICAMIHLAEKRQLKAAAIKPFDTGLLNRNAREQPGDGELFCKAMGGGVSESLVAPYIAHESYPLDMALRRDGININWDKITERLSFLDAAYDVIFIECPPSLFTPLDETQAVYEWLTGISREMVWLVHPVQAQFNQNLAEIQLMKTLDLQVRFVLNNASKIVDQDLLFYVWEKLESIAEQTMAGLIPFEGDAKLSIQALAGKIEENIPATVEALFSK